MMRAALLLLVVTAAVGCRPEAEPAAAPSGAVVPESLLRDRSPQAEPAVSGVLPSFRMIGAESGFDFERYDDIGDLRRIFESTGGGAGLLDFDRNGWLDIIMTNGIALPRKGDDPGEPSALYRNLGGMQFSNVTHSSGLVQRGYGQGCAVGDYDADGFDDVYVLAFGRNALWRNNGDGTFTDVTERTGTQVSQWSSSGAFADINGDGHLDLYVVNYLDESSESPLLCPRPGSPGGYEQCPPSKYAGVDDVLFLSDGRGGFVDATAASGISGLQGKGLGVVVSDLDGNGRPEIYVANDGEANFLFVSAEPEPGAAAKQQPNPANPGNFILDERALSSGVALSGGGHAQASMGVAAGDYDRDGAIDLFLTHFYGDSNTLYRNLGGLSFQDITRTAQLAAPSRSRLGWGTTFIDFDNNGWLDLFVANGHVEDRVWMGRGEPYAMRPQMFRNEQQGIFADVSTASGAYFDQQWLGRSVAAGDLDRDGRQDLVVSHQLAPSTILRNETPTANGALTLRFVGTRSNRNGFGARVEVVGADPPLVREMSGGTSFQSAPAPEVQIGMEARERVTVRVTWPSGQVDTHSNLTPGAWLLLEGQEIAYPR